MPVDSSAGRDRILASSSRRSPRECRQDTDPRNHGGRRAASPAARRDGSRSGIHGASPSTPMTGDAPRRRSTPPRPSRTRSAATAARRGRALRAIRHTGVQRVPRLHPVPNLGERDVREERRELVASSSLVALQVPGTVFAVPPLRRWPRARAIVVLKAHVGARVRAVSPDRCGALTAHRRGGLGRAGVRGLGDGAGTLPISRLVAVDSISREPLVVQVDHLRPGDEPHSRVRLGSLAEDGVELSFGAPSRQIVAQITQRLGPDQPQRAPDVRPERGRPLSVGRSSRG